MKDVSQLKLKKNSSAYKLGFGITINFILSQHIRDEELMKSLVSYLGCGVYSSVSGKDHGNFVVTRLSDITEKIIPFFYAFQLLGVKSLDYMEFCKAAEIMKDRRHLTEEGLEEIKKKIKAGMNRGRS